MPKTTQPTKNPTPVKLIKDPSVILAPNTIGTNSHNDLLLTLSTTGHGQLGDNIPGSKQHQNLERDFSNMSVQNQIKVADETNKFRARLDQENTKCSERDGYHGWATEFDKQVEMVNQANPNVLHVGTITTPVSGGGIHYPYSHPGHTVKTRRSNAKTRRSNI